MRLTLVHPCIGRRVGERYIRSWQMEPLPPATLAGLTPATSTSVSTTTGWRRFRTTSRPISSRSASRPIPAKRAYQIASEYRRRGVPVVMGGFHATLCPDEVAQYAEIVVVGEAESVWPQLIDDVRHGRLERVYRATGRPSLSGLRPNRRIFRGKRYLPIGLVEAGRGCHFRCDFCAVQAMFKSTQTRRPIDEIMSEVARLRDKKKLFFFVDDNITSNLAAGEGVAAGAGAAQGPLGEPGQHQRGARRRVPRPARPERLPGRAHRLREPRPGDPGRHEQELQHDARRLRDRRSRTCGSGTLRLYGTFIFGYDADTPETLRARRRVRARRTGSTSPRSIT